MIYLVAHGSITKKGSTSIVVKVGGCSGEDCPFHSLASQRLVSVALTVKAAQGGFAPVFTGHPVLSCPDFPLMNRSKPS